MKQANLFFRRFYLKFNLRVLLSFCLFFFANLSLVLVIKLLQIKKYVTPEKFWYFLNIKYRDCFHSQYTSLIKFLENTPRSIYLFKVNYGNTRKISETCLNWTAYTPKRSEWRHTCIFIVKFEHNWNIILVFLALICFDYKEKLTWNNLKYLIPSQKCKHLHECKLGLLSVVKVISKDELGNNN